MPTTSHGGAKIEFSRPLATARLIRDAEHAFDERATEEERAALAGLFGARGVDRFEFAGTIRRDGPDGLRLDGRLRASVVQSCVVTLAPVTSEIDEQVVRVYSPDIDPESIDLDSDEDETLEPLTRTLDIGLVATEAAALALPAYPRAPGVGAGDLITDGPENDAQREKPFAALAALREKLADKP